MKVNHSTFGQGTVISKDEKNVTVDFNGTVKTLVIAFARLTNEDGTAFGLQYQAPVKKAKAPKRQLTAEQKAKLDRSHARFMKDFNMAQLKDVYLDCQIEDFKRRGMLNPDNTLKN